MRTTRFPALMAAALGVTPLADANEGLPALVVQAVTFQVPSEVGLIALETATTQDSALFEQMVVMVAEGKAWIVFDQTLTARSGQPLKSGSGSEMLYPTEHEPNAKLFQAQPTAFNTRHVGDRLQCEAVLGSDGDIIDATFKIETVLLKRIEPLATPNVSGLGPAMGGVDQPLFVSSYLLAPVTLRPGRPMLIGLAPAADIYEHGAGPTAPHGTRLTFARATVLGSSEAPDPAWRGDSDLGPQLRLHTIGIRIPTATAAELLQDEQLDSAKLLSDLVGMVRRREATLVHHAAGVSRSGNRSHARHVAEIIHADDFDPLIPTSFVSRYVGTDAEVEATPGAHTWHIDANISIEEGTSPRPKRHGVDLENPALFITVPELPSTVVRTMVEMPQAGVRLLAAASGSSADDVSDRAPDTTDLYFLKAAATAAPVTSDGLPPMVEMSALLYSVSEAEAAALEAILFSDAARRQAAEELAERLDAGACHLAALALLQGKQGPKWSVDSGLFGTDLEGVRPLSVGPGVFARLPKRESCFGVSLQMEAFISGDGKSVELKGAFRYDPAPPLDPPDALIRSVLAEAKSGQEALVEAPVFTEVFTLAEHTKFAGGESRLVAVRPSLAPDGYPESGRWHALVMRVRLKNR